MEALSYYWNVLRRASRDTWRFVVQHLVWETVITIGIGVVTAVAGGSAIQLLGIPLVFVGGLVVLALFGNLVLTPVRLTQASLSENLDLRAQLKRETDRDTVRNELISLYDGGKHLLVLMESEQFRVDMSDKARKAWQASVTSFFLRIDKPGRAAVWDRDIELSAKDTYSNGEKTISGDHARACHRMRTLLRELERDVEFGSVV